jgi:hypothetical protein
MKLLKANENDKFENDRTYNLENEFELLKTINTGLG